MALAAPRVRAPGVVYTPTAVCAAMVELALAPLVAGRSRDDLLALRVCDPAIGEGAFLVEVVRALANAIGGADARRLVAERCVFGVDVDASAVARARRALARFAGTPVALGDHLRVADALALDWAGEFGAFDAVVGNPPYIRQEKLGAIKQRLRAFASYDGVADLYVYFVELARRIVRPGGRWCLVVPNKWMTAAYGRPLRALLADGGLDGVVDFGRTLPLFDVDAFPCIAWGTTGARNRTIRAARVTAPTDVAAALAAAPAIRTRWSSEPWHIDASDDSALIDRLARRFPPLAELVPTRPARGVVTGCNRAFVIDAATRARLVDAEPAAADLVRPLVKGRDVRPWRAADADRFVLLVEHGRSLADLPGVLAHLARFRAALEPRPPAHRGAWSGRKPGAYRWYELQDPVGAHAIARAPRLFYQDIQTRPACCLARRDDVPDTTVWTLATDDRVVLAIMNSSLYGWYARRRFPPALNGAVRPKLAYVRALPIATPTPDLAARIARLVDGRLAGHADDTQLDDAIFDAYELSRRERALVRAG
jgi:hypothetical protein